MGLLTIIRKNKEKEREKWTTGSTVGVTSGGTAVRKGHGHKKSASVSFDEPEKTRLKEPERDVKPSSEDERRRERRRSEAKAAIEVCIFGSLHATIPDG